MLAAISSFFILNYGVSRQYNTPFNIFAVIGKNIKWGVFLLIVLSEFRRGNSVTFFEGGGKICRIVIA